MQMGLGVVGAVYTNKSKATLNDTVPIAKLIEESEAIVVPKGLAHTSPRRARPAWKADPGKPPWGRLQRRRPRPPDADAARKAVGVTPRTSTTSPMTVAASC